MDRLPRGPRRAGATRDSEAGREWRPRRPTGTCARPADQREDRHDAGNDRHAVLSRRTRTLDEVEVEALSKNICVIRTCDAGGRPSPLEMSEIVLGETAWMCVSGKRAPPTREGVVGGGSARPVRREVLEAALGLAPALLVRGRVAAEREDVVDADAPVCRSSVTRRIRRRWRRRRSSAPSPRARARA